MEHLTELSQSLCDAAKDLDPQSLVGKIAEDLLECDHLVILADMPVTRECASTAKDRLNAEPHELVNLVVAHYKKIIHYLLIRSLIFDREVANLLGILI